VLRIPDRVEEAEARGPVGCSGTVARRADRAADCSGPRLGGGAGLLLMPRCDAANIVFKMPEVVDEGIAMGLNPVGGGTSAPGPWEVHSMLLDLRSGS
jgi:phosphotransacetylase